ncbi:hypothetical protein GH714_028963 [Hevea brasiliensis]|uniref:C2H2-type domain-containing protein n=1 Tax=Hevea brasiliensis TaxID=3981 RepID=A0A6A6NK58_HEVBR|nr:hypothetical protein GH714_028963 [Hevea brasiliensis]
MEANPKKKLFICKFCNKRYPCGKSLGGHIRIHLNGNGNSIDIEEDDVKLNSIKSFAAVDGSNSKRDSEPEAGAQSGYGLRENPRRLGEPTEKLKDQVMDSQSDTETSTPKQEQEEVAMCLMMLSKDSGFKGCFSSIADSSDNNSAVLETKSSSPKMKISVKNGIREDFDPELGKRLSRFRRIKMELRKDLTEEDRYDEADRAPLKYDSRKRGKNESYHTEFLSSNASKTAGGHRTNHKKTTICSDRVYGSGENSIDSNCVPNPLPSGSISSKKIKSCSGKNPIEHNLSGSSEKKLGFRKVKVHECPFCFKVFRSGQALGGHKRSHFVGGAEDRTVVINQEVPKISMPGLIDLNLPAPMEEDSNGYYIPTW